ncbi:hypothetical protein EYF80_045623 [Liparis tanakae]|uniref:Uncharacterized protein n=1 Tax=Liparis tanakae TaxID=230148 RepID=A0A4Z2FSP0_9TELE|nr:hypothetical protein EYF80_045623 [Liparis tanakae]
MAPPQRGSEGETDKQRGEKRLPADKREKGERGMSTHDKHAETQVILAHAAAPPPREKVKELQRILRTLIARGSEKTHNNKKRVGNCKLRTDIARTHNALGLAARKQMGWLALLDSKGPNSGTVPIKRPPSWRRKREKKKKKKKAHVAVPEQGIAPTSIRLNGARPLWHWEVGAVMYCGADGHKLDEAD